MGWWAVLTEQQFRAHPTNRPRGGNGGRRQGDCAEVDRDCHETKVSEASGSVVVDENIRLLSRSVRWGVSYEFSQYPFEISVNNPEFVKVGRSGHNLVELEVIKGRKSITRE